MSDITSDLAKDIAKRQNVGSVELTFAPRTGQWQAGALPTREHAACLVLDAICSDRNYSGGDILRELYAHQQRPLAFARGATPDAALRALIVEMTAKGLR